MSLIKKTRNDAVKAAVTSYLERRNYPDIDLFSSNNSLNRSAEQMAVATIVQCEASRANSILFSCINNDPGQYDIQYTRLVNFIKEVNVEKVKNELLGLLSPLLCHLYLEMLRGGHGGQAQMFLKRHSATLPQKDLSYHQPIDGNLPSALYRPNSLEQLFNSLQNGTIDNETPEKDYMNQILDDIGSIYTLQEVEARPSIAAFRSCKYDVYLSQDALNMLKAYLAKQGHVLLIQVLQTWFNIDINSDTNKKNSDDEDQMEDEINITKINTEEKVTDTNDIFSKCNGHAEYQSVDKELRDLQDAIKGVRESMVPLKLYKVAAPDSQLICAKTDPYCNLLCGGFSNSEIRLWDLGQNNVKRIVNRNISEFELACFMPPEPSPEDNTLQVGTGLPLRGHTGPIQAVSVLAQEQLVLSASHDNTMRAWRLFDYSCASIYRGHNYPIWCMDVAKNGLYIVTGSHDRTAKLWSLDRTFPVRVFVGHMSDVTFHPNEAYIASGGADRSVRLWSVCDARLVRVLCGHRGVVRALAFAPSGDYLASAGSQELIYITHIVDPHNFYVQRSCHQKLVKDMLREFRNASSMPKPSVNHVSEGKVYLVFNKTDNMWQRCRVISIDRRNPTHIQVHVFCLDFGSTEVVGVDKLRLLPPARLQSPYPLALNCSLANCVPKSGYWTSDDSILIQNIIDNKQAVIHVRHIRSTSDFMVRYECDVTTFEDGVSIAHALVFHERAKMINPRLPYPMITGIVEKPKLFTSSDFKPKSVEEVYITYIVSPDKFFVRKRHLQGVYEKLCEEMDQEYSMSVNTGSIYLPELGMVCVVNTEKYRAQNDCAVWARCVVTELPGRGRARLLLPDTGAELLVHWSALRRIQRQFTTARALATECHLAGVTAPNKKWSTASVALLQRYQDRLLELHVDEASRARGLGVTLYDKADPDNAVCVNSEMIKHKFAVSFGIFKFHKNDAEEQVITNKTPLDTPKMSQKPKPEVTILKRQSSPKRKIKDEDLEAKDKGPLRLEAKVLHYQSPSLLYISLLHQNKLFNDLYEKIQKYYTTKKTQGKSNWAVGERCCTICAQSQTWRRAVIVELENENAKIFYSDFACVETVPIASLRELPTEFAAVGDAAIKCHLCGVIPAVGEEWPSLTKEYLKELLDAYTRVFITKQGTFKNKSMPIEIWVYHTIQGGALEPNKSEWRCLNMKIIEQGLGIPDKTQESTSPEKSDADDGMLSFLNVTGSVNEWLQLEPMPTKPLVNESDPESPLHTPSPDIEESASNMDVMLKNSKTVFISDWLPPEPLPNKEFTAMPTYIDNDGVIYLHDVCQQDTLDLIRKALDVRFKKPDPKAKYAKWTVGEPCIAMFFLDNQFYRGRILEVNEDESSCIVHYVDYGNEEICTFENLRKSIALYQIPVQAHRCVLDRIRPVNDQWDRQTLDYIHKSIVEKQCFVKISGEKNGDLIPIELKYDKLWINDHLVDFEMAVYTDGSKAVVRRFAPRPAKKQVEEAPVESDSGPDYIIEESNETGPLSTTAESFDMETVRGKDWNKLIDDDDDDDHSLEGKYNTYPKFDKEEFLCNITIINDTKTLELSIVHDDETNLVYEEMLSNLQTRGENMCPLNGIFENKACVALFHEDGQWYRASILQHSELKNQIKVRYVDYGNVEIISLADAREITDEFTNLPPASMEVKLHGVKLNEDVGVDIISEEFTNVFLDKGPFTAKVIKYSEPHPIVELRNDSNELVYESLINKGIFLKSDD